MKSFIVRNADVLCVVCTMFAAFSVLLFPFVGCFGMQSWWGVFSVANTCALVVCLAAAMIFADIA